MRLPNGIRLINDPQHGDKIDALGTVYPTELEIVGDRGFSERAETTTTYGYVLRGAVQIKAPSLSVCAEAGGYFAVAGALTVAPVSGGVVVLIRRLGFRGQTTFGVVEPLGRLSYIDGCSDSLLVYPPRQGDPCLNHLHFPAGIEQTQHTHPTIRMGIVIRGSGEAFSTSKHSPWSVPLKAGMVFLLGAQEQHSFKTLNGETMDVVAYHPDSDWGPTDAIHPMRNRTYIGNDRAGA